MSTSSASTVKVGPASHRSTTHRTADFSRKYRGEVWNHPPRTLVSVCFWGVLAGHPGFPSFLAPLCRPFLSTFLRQHPPHTPYVLSPLHALSLLLSLPLPSRPKKTHSHPLTRCGPLLSSPPIQTPSAPLQPLHVRTRISLQELTSLPLSHQNSSTHHV